MKDDGRLPIELLWRHDGHLTDVALTAAGDGQGELLPDCAHEHLAACEACLRRAGEAARVSCLIAAHVVEAKRAAAVRRAIPRPALVAAFVAMALGAAPSLAALPGHAGASTTTLVRGVPVVMRGVAVLLRACAAGLQEMNAGVLFGSAAVLVAVSVGVSRALAGADSPSGGLS